MNERKPVKSLMDLKMTNWYVSRAPMIQETICKYPPGYYLYSGNGEIYRLIGWSNPEVNLGETEVHIYLEREIEGGTERLRLHPNYVMPETESVEASEQVVEEVSILEPLGFYIGKDVEGTIRFLTFPDSQERRTFSEIVTAKHFLVDSGLCTPIQLDDFVYEPYYT